jgi:hypothetical protein
MALLLFGLTALCGCSTEAIFPLRADSPMPEVWKKDPRTRRWKHFAIAYETRTTTYGPDVIAHVGPEPAPWYELWGWFWLGCFNERGVIDVECPQRLAGGNRTVCFTFRGITERYELVPPDPSRGEIGVSLRLLPPKTPATLPEPKGRGTGT